MSNPYRVSSPPGRPLSALEANLDRLAADHPNGGEALVAVHRTNESARVAATLLRRGTRAARRPAGKWDFTSGLVAEGPDAGKHGVWARFTPLS